MLTASGFERAVKFPPIDQLVPHEPPMRLIDAVLGFDPSKSSIVCSALPDDNCPFANRGVIPAIVSLEFMAQTVAAYVTMLRIVQTGSRQVKPRVGYIISARNLKLRVAHLETRQALTITAKLMWRDSRTANFDCKLLVGEQPGASTQLSVYEPPEAEPLSTRAPV